MIERLDEAKRLEYEDTVAIQIARVEALEAQGRDAEAGRLVAELAGGDAGPHQAEILVLAAERAGPSDIEESERLARWALELDQQSVSCLDPADREFAPAPVAGDSQGARAHLQWALANEPSHRKAMIMLVQVQLLLGAAAGCDSLIERIATFYPRGQDHVVLRVLQLGLLGRREQALAELRRHEERLPESAIVILECAAEVVSLVDAQAAAMADGLAAEVLGRRRVSLPILHYLRALTLVGKVIKRSSHSSEDTGIRLAPVVQRTHGVPAKRIWDSRGTTMRQLFANDGSPVDLDSLPSIQDMLVVTLASYVGGTRVVKSDVISLEGCRASPGVSGNLPG